MYDSKFFSDCLREHLREARNRLLVARVVDPAPPLFRPNEPRAAQQGHVVRDRRLREPDRLLDVAGTQPPLFAPDQIAAGASTGVQELEDLQARGIPEGLENRDGVGLGFHELVLTCINTALGQQAPRNSADCFRASGAAPRSSTANPNRGKNFSAVWVSRYTSVAPRSLAEASAAAARRSPSRSP